MDTRKLGFNSRQIHAGHFPDQYHSVSVPIYQTSTFSFTSADHGAACFAGEDDGYIYTRLGNPTTRALEDAVAQLEGGFGGIATASGMGAVTTVYMHYLSQGAHIVCSEAVYGPSRGVLQKYFSRFGVEADFVDTSDIEAIRKAIKPNTKLLYIETPANPTIVISDIRACADLAHENGFPLVVDNTFCSPYLQRPFELGADVVLHSMTKFINGHADIVGGIIIAKTEEDYRAIYSTMATMGPNIDPHQAYLAYRGLKTLSIRVERAQENAMKVAKHLEEHPNVAWIRYPGLVSHPQHDLAKKQMMGFGAMISFGLKGGLEAGKILMDNVRLASLAVSLGGVETLIQHPASMTHSHVPKEGRLKAGITDELVRLSVGIEDVEDILADLDQALAKIG